MSLTPFLHSYMLHFLSSLSLCISLFSQISLGLIFLCLSVPPSLSLLYLLTLFVLYFNACGNAIDTWRHSGVCTHYSSSLVCHARGLGVQMDFPAVVCKGRGSFPFACLCLSHSQLSLCLCLATYLSLLSCFCLCLYSFVFAVTPLLLFLHFFSHPPLPTPSSLNHCTSWHTHLSSSYYSQQLVNMSDGASSLPYSALITMTLWSHVQDVFCH